MNTSMRRLVSVPASSTTQRCIPARGYTHARKFIEREILPRRAIPHNDKEEGTYTKIVSANIPGVIIT